MVEEDMMEVHGLNDTCSFHYFSEDKAGVRAVK